MRAALALALFAAGCTCSEPEPSTLAPEPEAPEPGATAEPAPVEEPGLAPRAPGEVAIERPDLTPAGQLRAPEIPEAERARGEEIAMSGGFALGATLEEARARCDAVGGRWTDLERTAHRCAFPQREAQPVTHVDVSITPGGDRVGRSVFVYTNAEPWPLTPAFVDATGRLLEALGPPRSESDADECALATPALLLACLRRESHPVRHSWSTGPSPAGDAERMGAAEVEDVAIALRPTEDGRNWQLVHERQRAGYTDAFVEAYADEAPE